MFLWKPSKAPEVATRRQAEIDPTARIRTRFIGVSDCSGFRTWRRNVNGQRARTVLIAAKKSRTFAKVGANPVSDIGDQTTIVTNPSGSVKSQ